MKVSIYIIVFICFAAQHLFAQQGSAAPFSWTNLPTAAEPRFKKDTFNIQKYGATADGITLNTEAIGKAIEACNLNGGGVVLVPGGLWLTGPLEMKSHVNLHIARDAVLMFTDDFDQYRIVEGIYEGRRSARNQSPISGTGLENIAITGSGIIDGNGDAWRMVGKDKLTEREWNNKVASGGMISADGKLWYPSAKTKLAFEQKRSPVINDGQGLESFIDIKDYLRPNLVVFNRCKKVLLEGVTFQNSPAWCLHPIMCEDLVVRNVFVKNPDYAQNGDGLDIESCKNVLVENSTFDVGDDAICIKSGKDEEGRKRGMPTENVVIRNNVVYSGHGGFVIGSEMSGGARNIFVYDCSFIGTDNGLRFKTVRGRGGIVENIFIRDIRMKDIVRDAILFDMYYFTKPPANNKQEPIPGVTVETPQFRNFHISHITCNGADKGIFVRGLPEMNVQDIRIDHVIIKSNTAIEIIEASGITLQHVKLISPNSKPLIYLENSKRVTLDDIQYGLATNVFLSVNGEHSTQIEILNTEVTDKERKLTFNNGANQAMLTH